MAWLEYLSKWTPFSGRVIKEDGTTENIADIFARSDDVNNQLSVIDGEIYTATWRGTVAAGETLHLAHPVVGSGTIRGIAFVMEYEGGLFEYTQTIGATLGATLETIPGYNADRRLIATPSLSPVLRVASVTGGIVVDRQFGDSTGTGSNKSAAALTESGLGGIFNAAHSPSFTFVNNGSGALQLALNWAWEEGNL